MDVELLLSHAAPSPGIPLTLRALVRMRGRAPEEGNRIPLNLALVLDRSGSMHGEKLGYAKAAAALLLRRVWPGDSVSVVAYDSRVSTLVAHATGDLHYLAEESIHGIQRGSLTNLSGGWLRGRDLAVEGLVEGGVNRILLMTDGLANEGITEQGLLAGLTRSARTAGISTTTIGFGADYDEDLLRRMADEGGGATYYIENPDQAPGVFEEEIEGLLSLAAQNVTVEVTPCGGVAHTSVRHSYPATSTGEAVQLDVGDLYAREPRLVLMEFRLDDVAPGVELDVASITVRGHVLGAGGRVETREVELPVRLRLGDGPLVEPEIRRTVLLLDAADARNEALGLQAVGDWDAAGRALKEAARRLEEELSADPHAENEARGLRDAAAQMTADLFDAWEAKYLFQEAYDQSRSRPRARERYRRE